MINLILFGPPGSGKGTQAAKLVDHYQLAHISTGDLFRYEMGNDTPLGLEAKKYMSKGELVPDEVTIGMLKNKVESTKGVKGFIFDGSSQSQGPYRNYEQEHAALIFLNADRNYPGRLRVNIEDCTFVNGVGDAIHAYTNTYVKVKTCTAINVFRGGFVLTGGNSIAEVKEFTTMGDIDPTGIDVEVA